MNYFERKKIYECDSRNLKKTDYFEDICGRGDNIKMNIT
jgi:hypothetical protein